MVNADVGELWDMPLGHAAVGMTPFCSVDANEHTSGFRFFAHGYWKDHLQGRPYHISALFVVDLFKFRRRARGNADHFGQTMRRAHPMHVEMPLGPSRRRGYGDQYRVLYDNLSKDPNSLSNLDQDLPNYAQHMVPIHSLPEEWLWCETVNLHLAHPNPNAWTR